MEVVAGEQMHILRFWKKKCSEAKKKKKKEKTFNNPEELSCKIVLRTTFLDDGAEAVEACKN